MTITFLVEIDLDDLSDIPGVAANIEDDLQDFNVISVKPWARPTLNPITPPTLTDNQQPT